MTEFAPLLEYGLAGVMIVLLVTYIRQKDKRQDKRDEAFLSTLVSGKDKEIDRLTSMMEEQLTSQSKAITQMTIVLREMVVLYHEFKADNVSSQDTLKELRRSIDTLIQTLDRNGR